jgi:cytochrome c oxidase subunit 4
MSEAAHSASKGEHPAHPAKEHAHPGAGEYLRIAAVLTLITAVEVAVFYIPAMAQWLVPILLVLSAVKFMLVVMFYMHLKFDHATFTWLFVLGLTIAAVIIVSLMLLFDAFVRFHQHANG